MMLSGTMKLFIMSPCGLCLLLENDKAVKLYNYQNPKKEAMPKSQCFHFTQYQVLGGHSVILCVIKY